MFCIAVQLNSGGVANVTYSLACLWGEYSHGTRDMPPGTVPWTYKLATSVGMSGMTNYLFSNWS
jgi:hypothetical protein